MKNESLEIIPVLTHANFGSTQQHWPNLSNFDINAASTGSYLELCHSFDSLESSKSVGNSLQALSEFERSSCDYCFSPNM